VRIAAPPSAAAQEAALEAHLIPVPGPELDPSAIREAAGASAQMVRKLADAGAHGRVAWLFGPGLGGSPQAGQVLDAMEETRRADRSAALVVDGSLGGGERAGHRLRAFAPDVVLLNRAEAVSLLPGPARLPGRGAQAETTALAGLARETGTVVVAKGPRDLVTDGARVWLVEAGHPGLARHGPGDVLAGVTAGLVAQALPTPDAAMLACYLVGTAGSALARDMGPGWLSRELLDAAGDALRGLLAEPAPAKPPAQSVIVALPPPGMVLTPAGSPRLGTATLKMFPCRGSEPANRAPPSPGQCDRAEQRGHRYTGRSRPEAGARQRPAEEAAAARARGRAYGAAAGMADAAGWTVPARVSPGP
jgi:NAD(P)H-hydrate repair Nnr-like enzyme with NAD(P)H-hydrate dehydratase domain